MTLPHQIVAPASPTRWCLVLHGILGSKTNWRGLVRRASTALPAWGFVLPDLRNHGDDRGSAAPHTLDAACDDFADLAAHRGHGFDAVIGHSYGAKCALAWVDRVQGALDCAVVVDGNPGARPTPGGDDTVVRAVAMLTAMQGAAFDARERFIDAVMADGFSRDVAAWLGMNLGHDADDAFRLRINMAAVRAMLDDYFARDLWRVVDDPPGRARVRVVIGGRSPALDADDRARVLRAVAAHPGRVVCDVVERAGHWVHVDAPDETVAIITDALRG